MRWEAHDGLLRRIFAIFIFTAALAGCGGGSSSSGATNSAPASTGNSSSNTSSAALVALSSSDYSVSPSATAVVTINRSGSSAGTATVGYTTVNGTATAGVDYVTTSGSVTWNDGESGAKTVTVPVMSAAKGKNFGFALTSVAGQADFGSPAAATIGVTASSSPSTGSATGTVSLTWSAPTQNTDGSALTNLAGFAIYYGKSATAMTQKINITTVGMLTYVFNNLSSGPWCFEILAVNSLGVESNPSGIVSTTI